ncbi:MAG TPA: shikimate dehydrogenase [Candidatus Limnocylindrales bacterium]|nr:shikimate dehydrogenase [Candidatus Limnocylindrales bacterium]
MSATTKKVGIIGWPVEHSVSPAMHNAAFAALGMTDWFYDRMAIPADILKPTLRVLADQGYVGVNVTVPHKEAVLQYIKPDKLAKRVGAINTIDFRNRIGRNTDVAGFMNDLEAHRVKVKGERVLILGAGGAARAAAYGLLQVGVGEIGFINRTPESVFKLAADLAFEPMIMSHGMADMFDPSLIVNCTSLGMAPGVDQSPWPKGEPFPKGVTVYDMVYRPRRTAFMAQAERAGVRALGGLGMLVHQGAAAFRVWTGVEPPIDVMLRAAEQALAE